MKKHAAYGLILIVALLLAGCAAASRNQGETTSDLAVGAVAPSVAGGAEFAPEEPQPFGTPAPALQRSVGDETSTTERVVIRTANLTLVVPSPADSVDEISRMASEMGGFVVSSNLYQTVFQDAGVTADQASITIRVPAERLDEALERIEAGATEVRNQNVSGQDVTQEYTDLQSRLRSLEAAEQQLLDIMQNATDPDNVLNVFNSLQQYQQQIEVTKGRIQYLSESAALSSISVDLIPDVAAAPLQIGGWQPQGTAKEAFTALVRALRFLGNAAIWAGICVLPVGLLLGVPSYFAGRAIIRRRREAKAEGGEKSKAKKN